MKIFISADMEGATGVVHVAQTRSTEKDYEFGRRMQLHDVRAVVEGALEAGAEEILINDAHGHMTNLDIGSLGFSSRVRLLSGSPKTFSMVEGCTSADAAFFVGYHAMAGMPHAILDHTISGAVVWSITLNGREVGETGLNAALCASQNIPLALVTGDAALCTEAKALMAEGLLSEGLVTACVKTAHGRMAADCLLPEQSAPLLKEAAREAMERARAGRSPMMEIGDAPFELRITFHNAAQCDRAATIPGTERLGGRTLRVTSPDMAAVMRWAVGLISLGGVE